MVFKLTRFSFLFGKIATDVVTPKIKETIALIFDKKFNLCLQCHSMIKKQLKMALKIGNVFINKDDLIPDLIATLYLL